MLRILRQFIEDLRQPGYYVRHQMALRSAFLILGLFVGIGTGVGMYAYAFNLMAVALGAIGAFLTTFSSVLLFNATLRQNFTRWVDDIIRPPVAVTVPEPAPSADNALHRGLLVASLNEFSTNIHSLPLVPPIKNDLKQLFALRSYSQIDDAKLNESFTHYRTQLSDLMHDIHSHADWDKPEVVERLKSLMIIAVTFSDQLLACMESEMRHDNVPVTTANVSQRLIDQSRRYCRDFLYAGIVDLYHRARAKYYVDNIDEHGEGIQHTLPPNSPGIDAFYQDGTPQNALRKVYNAFVKHGFYQRYGNKAFDYQLRSTVRGEGDQRFANWTQKDKNKDFRPMPDMRPT